MDKALELNPELPEAHIALGRYHYHRYYDCDRALDEFAVAQKFQPSNTEVLGATVLVKRRQGKFEHAAANLKRFYDFNPRDRILIHELEITYEYLLNNPEAEHYFGLAISLYPDWLLPYRSKAWLYLHWEGSVEKARAVLEREKYNSTMITGVKIVSK